MENKRECKKKGQRKNTNPRDKRGSEEQGTVEWRCGLHEERVI